MKSRRAQKPEQPERKPEVCATGSGPKPGWYSKAEVCAFLDYSTTHFDTNIRPLLRGECVDETCRPMRFYGRAVVDALLERAAKKDSGFGVQGSGDDDDDADPETAEYTKRWKKARAEKWELHVATLRGELVGREEVHGELVELAGLLRRCGETLQRKWPAAAELLNECLEAFEKRLTPETQRQRQDECAQ